jgi:tetratricopeptide (TPR) repeat protein
MLKQVLILLLITTITLLSLAPADAQSGSDLIDLLTDADPEARADAARWLGKYPSARAIRALITTLDDPAEDVRNAAADSLVIITGMESLGADREQWDTWWKKTGMVQYGSSTSDEVRSEMLRKFEQHQIKFDDLRDEIDVAKWRVQLVGVIGGLVMMLGIALMIAFAIMGGNRLKGIRELIRQADKYIQEQEKITQRTDKILEELEAKKLEVMDFIAKVKEDNIAEFERFSDMSERNSEHRLREIVMGLREKAEKEIDDSLTDKLTGVDRKFKKMADAEKERVGSEVDKMRDSFQEDVNAQTRFLEANYLHTSGRLDEALRMYRQILQTKDDHFVARMNMGAVLRDLGRYEEALDAFRTAESLSPNSAEVAFNIATVFALQKKKGAMLDALGQAVASDAEFKDEALNDSSFREYWNDPAFKDLAEA